MEAAHVQTTKRRKSSGKGLMLLVVLFVLAITIGGTFLGLAALGHFSLTSKNPSTSSGAESASSDNSNTDNHPINDTKNATPNDPNNTTKTTTDTVRDGDTAQEAHKNGDNREEHVETFVENTVRTLSSHVLPGLVIPLEQTDNLLPQLTRELVADVKDPIRLSAYIQLARKASTHLKNVDKNNKRRSSVVASMGKLANLLLVHAELKISEPLVPLLPLGDEDGVYLDPTVLEKIKVIPGEEGLKFLQALRIYVQSLSIEKANAQDGERGDRLTAIVNGIKKYMSDNYQ